MKNIVKASDSSVGDGSRRNVVNAAGRIAFTSFASTRGRFSEPFSHSRQVPTAESYVRPHQLIAREFRTFPPIGGRYVGDSVEESPGVVQRAFRRLFHEPISVVGVSSHAEDGCRGKSVCQAEIGQVTCRVPVDEGEVSPRDIVALDLHGERREQIVVHFRGRQNLAFSLESAMKLTPKTHVTVRRRLGVSVRKRDQGGRCEIAEFSATR